MTKEDFVDTQIADTPNRNREGRYELPGREPFTPMSVTFTVKNARRVLIFVDGVVVKVCICCFVDGMQVIVKHVAVSV